MSVGHQKKQAIFRNLQTHPLPHLTTPHANERRGAGSEVNNCSRLCEEKTLMLGKIEGKGEEDAEDKIDSVTNSMEMNLSKLLETV